MVKLLFHGHEVTNVSIDGVKNDDYPDFCDAYFDHAEWEDTGIPLSDDDLNELTEIYGDVINEMAHESVTDYAADMYDYMMDR
jgi:hypothetical protein